jgi:hypothetical protein
VGVDLLVQRAVERVDDDLGVGGIGESVDGLARALVLAVTGGVLDQRGFEDEQRLVLGERRHLVDEEVGDAVEQVVAVVLVGREVGERVRAGDDGSR